MGRAKESTKTAEPMQAIRTVNKDVAVLSAHIESQLCSATCLGVRRFFFKKKILSKKEGQFRT